MYARVQLVRARGIGLTNLVHRATARAGEIDDDEVRAGVPALTALVERIRPDWVAFLGLGASRGHLKDHGRPVQGARRPVAG